MLVAARALAHTWRGSAVVMRLDYPALVAAMKKCRHQHEPINDIMSELNHLQMKHDFVLTPAWVRRFKNEAADALSKDDMPRFWHNRHPRGHDPDRADARPPEAPNKRQRTKARQVDANEDKAQVHNAA